MSSQSTQMVMIGGPWDGKRYANAVDFFPEIRVFAPTTEGIGNFTYARCTLTIAEHEFLFYVPEERREDPRWLVEQLVTRYPISGLATGVAVVGRDRGPSSPAAESAAADDPETTDSQSAVAALPAPAHQKKRGAAGRAKR